MDDYIRYESAGYGDSGDNNSKEVCDWIHSRIIRKKGHAASRVCWSPDNVIEILMDVGPPVKVGLGSYVTWVNVGGDFTRGYFQVVTHEEREASWSEKLRLGEPVWSILDKVKGLASKTYHDQNGFSEDYRTLLRVSELLIILDRIVNDVAKTESTHV